MTARDSSQRPRAATLPNPEAHPNRRRYPINMLRNVAIRAVTTSHYFLCDVDLFPSSELHAELLALDQAYWHTPRLALVVAAFTLDSRATPLASQPSSAMPRRTPQLSACVAGRVCVRSTSTVREGHVECTSSQ